MPAAAKRPQAGRSQGSPRRGKRGVSAAAYADLQPPPAAKEVRGKSRLANQLEEQLGLPPEQAAAMAKDVEPLIAGGVEAGAIIDDAQARAQRYGGFGPAAECSMYKALYNKALSMRVTDKIRFNKELAALRREAMENEKKAAADRVSSLQEFDQKSERQFAKTESLADNVASLRSENKRLHALLAAVEQERDDAFEDRATAEQLMLGAKKEMKNHAAELGERRARERQLDSAAEELRQRFDREEDRARGLQSGVEELRAHAAALAKERDGLEREAAQLRHQLRAVTEERDEVQDVLAASRAESIDVKRRMSEDLSEQEQARRSQLSQAGQEAAGLRAEIAKLTAQVNNADDARQAAQEELDEYKKLFKMKTAMYEHQVDVLKQELGDEVEMERSRHRETSDKLKADFVTMREHHAALDEERRDGEKRVAEAVAEGQAELEGLDAASRKLLREGETVRRELEREVTALKQRLDAAERHHSDEITAGRASLQEERLVLTAQAQGKAQEVTMLTSQLEAERVRRAADVQRLERAFDEERQAWARAKKAENGAWDEERAQLRRQLHALEAERGELIRRERDAWEKRLAQREQELSTALHNERERSRAELQSARSAADLERKREKAERLADQQQWDAERAQLTQKLRDAKDAAQAEATVSFNKLANDLRMAQAKIQTLEEREQDMQEAVSKYVKIIGTSKDQIREYQRLFELADTENASLKLLVSENRGQATAARAKLIERGRVLSDKEDALHSAMLALKHRNGTVEEMTQATEETEERLRQLQGRNGELEEAIRLQDEVLEEERAVTEEQHRLRQLEVDVEEERRRARQRSRVDREDEEVRGALEKMERLLAATPAELVSMANRGQLADRDTREGVSSSRGSGSPKAVAPRRSTTPLADVDTSSGRVANSGRSTRNAQWLPLRTDSPPPPALQCHIGAGVDGLEPVADGDLRSGVAVDLTGDGLADAVGFDTTGDGRIDSLDTNFDGRIDVRLTRCRD
eukprot:TRINITY_DN21585_c0_g1_i1.p1 TRINITY_DN21585_c0_g1~~TRINITY_DN21585_c0_g1_i1.p1  ORF type:complete len:1016 (+),score=362.29 TRINITY_DN21585_c0_g1_i1:65-3049(+)